MKRSVGVTLGLLALVACSSTKLSGGNDDRGGHDGEGGVGGLIGNDQEGGSGGQSGAAGSAVAGQGGGASGGASGQGAGGTAGNTDAGVDGPATVLPQKVGSLYRLAFDQIVFEVNPEVGGRIVKFAHGTTNVLTTAEANADNWGSTIWPSPQSVWNWPPPAELDRLAYAATIEGNALVLQSQVHAATGLKLQKRFHADPPRIVQTFTLTNTTGATRAWGAWQVSRVPPDGLTLFGLGTGATFTRGTWQALPADTVDQVLWITHQPSQLTKPLKTFADGKGWLAHVLPSPRLVFLKTFADVPNNGWAEGEAEIEIFADGAGKYVEVEPQSGAKSLGPGQSLTWGVSWQLSPLPAGVQAVAKNGPLLAFVKSLQEP